MFGVCLMAFFVVSLMGPFQNECEKTYCNSFAFRNRSMDCAHAVGGQCAILFSHDDVRGKTLVTYVVVCLGQIQHLFWWILFVFGLCFFQGCHSGLICLVKIADI